MGINHVAIEVDDLDAALDFYGRAFQFGLRGRLPRMAFLDMGDQFMAIAETSRSADDEERHFGLVVDDLDGARRGLVEAGAEILPGSGLDFRDPWGNHVQVVEYSEVQFTKTPAVLEGMGLGGLGRRAEGAGGRSCPRRKPAQALALQRLGGVLDRRRHHRPGLPDRLRVAREVHDRAFGRECPTRRA